MLSSAQKASSLIKNILDIVKETAARDNIIELQNIVLALQEKNADLIEIKQKLEAKLMEYENWEEIAKKYSLAELAPGVFVYASNPDRDGGQPRHNLCANCFHQKQKSILNRSGLDTSGVHYSCPNCGTKFTDYTQAVDTCPPDIV